MSELINNRQYRIETLKHIIKELHSGAAPEAVRKRLRELVRETDAGEIAAMEQELIAEGMPVAEVQAMCDHHSAVLREVVVERREQPIAPGHPVDTFRRENAAIAEAVEKMRAVLEKIAALPDDQPAGSLLLSWRQSFNTLMDLDKHYRRKENLLFSYLEKHGVTGPSKVMWGKDDEVRELLKALGIAIGEEDALAGEWKMVIETVATPALAAVAEMIYKEEKILLPMALDSLTPEEWGELWRQTPEYGYCMVEPGEGYQPPEAASPGPTAAIPEGRAVVFPTGSLSYEQMLALFSTLPVDVTFVDAEDRVRWFSPGEDRVFARSRAIVGRKVQHCHPPGSVDVVERILSDFRESRQDKAEFWIEMRGRFVHITYHAMRDAQARYLGTLEVTQDATRVRGLVGERRLLEYDAK